MSQDRRAFRVAQRRNEQHRGTTAFVKAIGEETPLDAKAIAILDPEASIDLEASLYQQPPQAPERHRGLSLAVALAHCAALLDALGDEPLNVILLNSPDFAFRCRASDLQSALEGLIVMDGDTVTAATTDLRTGFALDVETEHASPSYEVALWRGG